ncbi:50S ribosomal protein L25/general stress protein Ctc [Schinkia azotoformans]|uniref:Large ribosomal subunit protein bL25 n=1 Tax=Schinkia azotoformans LMG 9581 TaxID=1131731 RepID=K6DPE0_SCHAZ|nr:50S ribosomal protein L25/general stress protein Ctc [Schinkia azotoformans]EKN62661.1 50S ribosomal protein L25/general stress protein Ctc [Schinkia azotoformans LMG 9581]MEC1641154.1 50S ribosomal protein L25/general stress protein Ctc [Schinkia azotoformans]MEC1719952.1 50S ribosomal protein L25/general stress protein Ctc [Schinkia azotoformans]MEC1947481.1 50S ribosomal protein L25/general stress protein Ctc [Schinkia azotoformans]MED4354407.1 50S ribosomal protein L25/general stress pr
MSTISAKKREDFRRSAITEIRQSGKFPAVVYGKDKPTAHIVVDLLEFRKTMRKSGRNGIIKLQVEDGRTESVMLHDVQMNPLNGEVVHADFLVVNMSKEVDIEVTVNLVGDAQGVKDGGTLQQPLYKVNVRCLPTNIPEKIDIDISAYNIGDVITVGDIKVDGKYEVLDDDSTVIASILQPKVEDEVGSGEVQDTGEAADQDPNVNTEAE